MAEGSAMSEKNTGRGKISALPLDITRIPDVLRHEIQTAVDVPLDTLRCDPAAFVFLVHSPLMSLTNHQFNTKSEIRRAASPKGATSTHYPECTR